MDREEIEQHVKQQQEMEAKDQALATEVQAMTKEQREIEFKKLSGEYNQNVDRYDVVETKTKALARELKQLREQKHALKATLDAQRARLDRLMCPYRKITCFCEKSDNNAYCPFTTKGALMKECPLGRKVGDKLF